jgi:hypothetical protein
VSYIVLPKSSRFFNTKTVVDFFIGAGHGGRRNQDNLNTLEALSFILIGIQYMLKYMYICGDVKNRLSLIVVTIVTNSFLARYTSDTKYFLPLGHTLPKRLLWEDDRDVDVDGDIDDARGGGVTWSRFRQHFPLQHLQ